LARHRCDKGAAQICDCAGGLSTLVEPPPLRTRQRGASLAALLILFVIL
jgi:hypothetical protein